MTRKHGIVFRDAAGCVILLVEGVRARSVHGILDGRTVASFEECYPESDNHPRFSMGWLEAERSGR
jgi:hypothetical protein